MILLLMRFKIIDRFVLNLVQDKVRSTISIYALYYQPKQPSEATQLGRL